MEIAEKYGRMMLNYRSSSVNPDSCMRFILDSLSLLVSIPLVFVNLAIDAEGLTFLDSPAGTLRIYFFILLILI